MSNIPNIPNIPDKIVKLIKTLEDAYTRNSDAPVLALIICNPKGDHLTYEVNASISHLTVLECVLLLQRAQINMMVRRNLTKDQIYDTMASLRQVFEEEIEQSMLMFNAMNEADDIISNKKEEQSDDDK